MGRIVHPEQNANEVFVGNVNAGPLASHLAGIKTARVGSAAYDIYGKKIPATEKLAPLFVGDADAGTYDRIMMARFRAASA